MVETRALNPSRAGVGDECLERTPMRNSCASAVVSLLLLASAGPGAPAETLDRTRFVPLEEIAAGARCVGKTVFEGTAVSEFNMEILGVVRGTSPRGNLIIARAEGEPLERTGILEGMSGSPVYLDGRLIGAVCATWAFSKEPIAGITPIEEMLPGLRPAEPGAGEHARPRGAALGMGLLREAASRASRLSWVWERSVPAARSEPASRATSLGAFGGRDMAPIGLPLIIPGGDAFARRLEGIVGAFGFSPVAGASRGGVAPAAEAAGGAEIGPGSAVGVALVTGDAEWAAVGTVTYRDGDRILAFGHPLFNAGEIEMPMVAAYVHALLPLSSISFKYASGTELIGTMVQDREKVVGGRLGAPPPMIPLAVDIVDGDGEPRHYALSVVRARPYASLFAGLAAGACVAEGAKSSGPAAVTFRATLRSGDDTLEYGNVFTTDEPAIRVAGELSGLMDIVTENDFEEWGVTEAALSVAIREEERRAIIERVEPDRAVYHPGDPVVLTITFREWQGQTVVKTLSLTLPRSVPEGTVTVRVGSAAAYREWESERLAEGLRPRSMRQLLDLIEQSKPDNVVVAQLLLDAPGVSLAGRELRAVPGRAALVIGSGAGKGTVDVSDVSLVAESELALDQQVDGRREFTLSVRERE
jgi:hypothetical protein